MNFSEDSPANGDSEAGKPSNEVPKVDTNEASSLLCSGAWNLFEHMIAYLQAKGFFLMPFTFIQFTFRLPSFNALIDRAIIILHLIFIVVFSFLEKNALGEYSCVNP